MSSVKPKSDKKNRLRQFKPPNQQQAAVMRCFEVLALLFRLYQFVTAARLIWHIQSSVDGEPMELSTPQHYHLIFTASTTPPPIYVRVAATSLQPSGKRFPTHHLNRSNPVSAERRSCL